MCICKNVTKVCINSISVHLYLKKLWVCQVYVVLQCDKMERGKHRHLRKVIIKVLTMSTDQTIYFWFVTLSLANMVFLDHVILIGHYYLFFCKNKGFAKNSASSC